MITQQFKDRFIEYYGQHVYKFIASNYKGWLQQAKVKSNDLNIDGVSKQRLNNAIADYLQEVDYEFKQIKSTDTGEQIRYHFFYECKNKRPPFNERRAWYLERFLNNYDFLLQLGTQELTIASLFADYKYWFKYRRISMFYGYNEATILHNVTEWLRAQGGLVIIGAKKIVVNNDQKGTGSLLSKN